MPPAKGRISDLSGQDKSAVIMLALGEEHGGKLWPLMDDEEVRDISIAMANLGKVDSIVVEKLFVEFANQIREQGKSVREAVVEASVLRLRPILMTTGAMVLGAVPLAIAVGAGAESRQDIGLVIVGGLLVGTFFTLLVIPVVYTYLMRERKEAAASAPATKAKPQPAE